MDQAIQRTESGNPALPDGTYAAVVEQVVHGKEAGIAHQIKILLRLPNEQTHLLATIRLPHRFDSDAQKQLQSFCQAAGISPEYLLKTPGKIKGLKVRVQTTRCMEDTGAGAHWFSRITRFLPWASRQQQDTELGMRGIAHQRA